jgi:hypothetical protein
LKLALASLPPDPDCLFWAVKLDPGIYYFGAESLSMVPHVDIEGSGADTYLGNDGSAPVVVGANAELRNLVILQDFTGYQSFPPEVVGVEASNSDLRLADVAIRLRNAGSGTDFIGIRANHAYLHYLNDFRSLTIQLEGGRYSTGIQGTTMSPRTHLHGVRIEVEGASSAGRGIDLSEYAEPRISDTSITIEGNWSGAETCGVRLRTWSRPHLSNVLIRSYHGTERTVGLHSESSSEPTIRDCDIMAGGWGGGERALSEHTAAIVIQNAVIVGRSSHFTAGGGAFVDGIYADQIPNGGKIDLADCTVSAHEASIAEFGINTQGGEGTSCSASIDRSTISSQGATVYANDCWVGIGNSRLAGGNVVTGGTGSAVIKCLGCYDENFDSAGYTTCP